MCLFFPFSAASESICHRLKVGLGKDPIGRKREMMNHFRCSSLLWLVPDRNQWKKTHYQVQLSPFLKVRPFSHLSFLRQKIARPGWPLRNVQVSHRRILWTQTIVETRKMSPNAIPCLQKSQLGYGVISLFPMLYRTLIGLELWETLIVFSHHVWMLEYPNVMSSSGLEDRTGCYTTGSGIGICGSVQQVSTSRVNFSWLFITDHSEYLYHSCCL